MEESQPLHSQSPLALDIWVYLPPKLPEASTGAGGAQSGACNKTALNPLLGSQWQSLRVLAAGSGGCEPGPATASSWATLR